jgi:minimal PKS acyl carrier protein
MAETSPFTLDDLRRYMRECAGVAESVDLDGNIGEQTFDDLGYDSLAVLEVTAKLTNHLGVAIADDVADQSLTPLALTEYVNARLAP